MGLPCAGAAVAWRGRGRWVPSRARGTPSCMCTPCCDLLIATHHSPSGASHEILGRRRRRYLGGHPSQPCEHICAPVVSHDYGCVCLKLSKALGQCGCFERATPRHLAQPAEYYCCCRARGRSWRASRLSKTSCPSSCPFSSCPFSSCASCLSCPSYSSLWCAPRAQCPAPYDDQS